MATTQKRGFKSDLLEFRDRISNMQESAIPKEIIAEEDTTLRKDGVDVPELEPAKH